MNKIALSVAMVALIMNFSSMAEAPPIVSIEMGQIQGVSDQGIEIFRGIPYAKPPLGKYRWRAPQPVDSWFGVRDATAYGHDCMQKPFPGDAAPLGTKPSEDCLVMNVWKPAGKIEKPLPVMVWIYGGGFVNGGSSPAVYDASAFAHDGIVAVSFNYRVGRFGFFAHPALTAENKDGVLGNYGFMDQIAALKWVQKNISKFGGDPTQVTLVGESAGGFSIHTLLTSPMAKGLFHQAIIQSGGGREGMSGRELSTTNRRGLPSAESVGKAFAAQHGITGTDREALDALRNLSAQEVTSGLNMATMADPTYSGPMIDGKLVVKQPGDYYSNHEKLIVPMMVGATSYEIGFAPKVSTYEQALAPFKGQDINPIKQAFVETGVTDPQAIAQAISSDTLMVEPTRYVLREAAEQRQIVYGYRFAYVADSMKAQWPGALHATDIPYAFDTVNVKYHKALTKHDQQMATLVHQYWANFIKRGDPNGANLPQWNHFDIQKDDLMWFSNEGIKSTHMVTDPWKKRLDYIESLQTK